MADEQVPRRGRDRRPLVIALVITAGFAAVEVAGGVLTGSLALVADAGHMTSDALAIGLSLFAAWLASRPRTPRKTYGYNRAEILAAQVNGAALVGIAAWTIWNAIDRLGHPSKVNAGPVMLVAALGVAVNLTVATVLLKSGRENLNARGALLDAASDSLSAFGTVIAGAVIYFTGFLRADAIASLVISALILVAAWRLLREVVDVLLEGTPAGVDMSELEQAMVTTPGVKGVHDMHVWTVTSGFIALSLHAEVEEASNEHSVLDALTEALTERFHIAHVTIQPETAKHAQLCCVVDCETDEPRVVEPVGHHH